MIAQFRRFVAGLLILALALPLPAQATLVATDAALDHQRIAGLLERTEVQEQLHPRLHQGVPVHQAHPLK